MSNDNICFHGEIRKLSMHFIEEWWKGHIVLPKSVHPSPSVSEMALAICV